MKCSDGGRYESHRFIRRSAPLFLCTVFISLLLSCSDRRIGLVESAFQGFNGKYTLYVSKSECTLYVYNRDGRVVAEYLIAYGLNPDRGTKRYAGDNRTPEGVYRIVEILSMDADKSSPAYRKLKAMNRVYFRARDGHYRYGHPDLDLGDNVYGSRFFLLDYPNEDDKRRYEWALKRGDIPRRNGKYLSIGYGIAIHGNNDPASIGHLASSGCIRMYNDDIVQLDSYIQLGTPVIISKD